jgi:Tfp pilus assembly protein PilE
VEEADNTTQGPATTEAAEATTATTAAATTAAAAAAAPQQQQQQQQHCQEHTNCSNLDNTGTREHTQAHRGKRR